MLRSLSRGIVLALGLTQLCAAQGIRIGTWETRAKLVSTPGAGIEQFRLRCETFWPTSASRDPSNYQVRVEGPGGRTVTHALNPSEMGAGRWTTVFVPAEWVRNRMPDSVRINVSLVEARSGTPSSNTISAEIDDFPRPVGSTEKPDPGPFGWGEPVGRRKDDSASLPRTAPNGLRFVLVPRQIPNRQLIVASTEATVAQVKRSLPDYDPSRGRSDEFNLEESTQPSINLTPLQANKYLRQLESEDLCRLKYRLPSLEEWRTAMLAGNTSTFWWGKDASFPRGANLLGPEPALPSDSTAKASGEGYEPNAWGLFHTIGNVEEWVTAENNGFTRIGGHFRSELDSVVPSEAVKDQTSLGQDPYVGVRPVVSFTSEEITDAIQILLKKHQALEQVSVQLDLDTMTVTLKGSVTQATEKRLAEEVVAQCWLVASVVNLIETPQFAPGKLAYIGPQAAPARRITPLGRWFDEVPMRVKWAEPLPVSGSGWWLNVYSATGGHYAHRLSEEPNTSQKITVLIDLAKSRPADGPVEIALSLGAEAPRKDDPRIVSNLYSLQYR